MSKKKKTDKNEAVDKAAEVMEKEQTSAENPTDKPDNEAAEVDPLQKMEDEITKLKDQNLRLYAEFENYRKRTSKERVELFSTANQELMAALLPVLDDFQRALKNLEGNQAAEGVQLIYSKLDNTLKNKGLKRMELSNGKDFDVDTMEAITRIPAPEDKLKGKVVDEIEPGYMLGNKILRYAKVVVGE